jgi:MerR family transcriptional regulator, light-induced transcriptional regulator
VWEIFVKALPNHSALQSYDHPTYYCYCYPDPESVSAASVNPLHPISVVAERTGISPGLLRMWERRYGAVAPVRTTGGERLYSDSDVERLQLLGEAVNAGRRIGRVARLATPELASLVEGDRTAAAHRPGTRSPARETGSEVIDHAIRHIGALDGRALEDLLRQRAVIEGTVGFVIRVAVPLLRRVGDEWHAGRLSIAEERLGSSRIEAVVAELFGAIRPPEGAPRVLVATLSGDRHVISALMAAAVAAAEGWNVVFLGGDLPGAEIVTAARAVGVQAVALSALYADRPDQMLAELQAVQAGLPARTPLIVGGQAVRPGVAPLLRSGVRVRGSLEDFRLALREIAAGL